MIRATSLKEIILNCPKELEPTFQKIYRLSREFVMKVEITPDDEIDEMKYTLQESKECLQKIWGILITTVRLRHEFKDDSLLDLGLRTKFEEDIGSVIGALRRMEATTSDMQQQVNFYLRIAVDLKTAFEYLVSQPIIGANNSGYKDVDDYMLKIFNVIGSNAAVLGYSTRIPGGSSGETTSKPSSILPSPRAMWLKQYEQKNKEKNVNGTEKINGSKKEDKKEQLKKDLEDIAKDQEEDDSESEDDDLSFETTE